MRKVVLIILFYGLFGAVAVAQNFFAIVLDCDTDRTPLYQANVAVSKDNQLLFELKTYFDGKFNFTTAPNATYTATISYPGRKDTAIVINTDKRGIASNSGKKIVLQKDGMRLMGKVIDRQNDMPIDAVGMTLKNIMTRKEDKIITKIDGAYNFKLEYETNYMLKIDRRSPGIFNKFNDTTLYISTVGFNLPLDYILDIYLQKTTETLTSRPEYDPYKKPSNQLLKPVVEVMGIKDSAKLAQQLKEVQSLRDQLKAKDSLIAAYSNKIVAKNDVKSTTNNTIQAEKLAAELKAKEEAAKLSNEKKQAEELERKLAEEKLALAKKVEEERLALELKNKEEARLAEEQRIKMAKLKKAEEDRKLLEQAKLEEQKRVAEQNRIAEEKARALAEKQAKEMQLAADKKMEEERQLAEKKQLEEQTRLKNEQERKLAIEKQRLLFEKRQEEDSLRDALHREQLMALEAKIAQQNSIENKLIQEKIEKEKQERAAIANKLKAIEDEEKLALMEESKKLEEELKQNRATYETMQNDLMAYYENKIKVEQMTTPEPKPTTTKAINNSASTPKTTTNTQQVVLTGKVISGIDNKALKDVSISVRNVNSIFSVNTESDNNGGFKLIVDNNNTYLISYYKEGYTVGKQVIDLSNNQYMDYKIPDFYILDENTTQKNVAVKMENIAAAPLSETAMYTLSFEKNSYNISGKNMAQVFNAVKQLKAAPNRTIAIYGMASKDEISARSLAEARVTEVTKFLEQNGIKGHRITIEILGSTKSISKCGVINPCTEEDYKKDRVVLYEIK